MRRKEKEMAAARMNRRKNVRSIFLANSRGSISYPVGFGAIGVTPGATVERIIVAKDGVATSDMDRKTILDCFWNILVPLVHPKWGGRFDLRKYLEGCYTDFERSYQRFCNDHNEEEIVDMEPLLGTMHHSMIALTSVREDIPFTSWAAAEAPFGEYTKEFFSLAYYVFHYIYHLERRFNGMGASHTEALIGLIQDATYA